MPACIGENIPVTFTCLCCHRTVQIWAFEPVHPDTSNTELLPVKWRQHYRQDWYVNPSGNRTFDNGQLFQLEYIEGQPILTAVALVSDDNPFVAGLVRIPEEGIGSKRVLWVCGECGTIATADPVFLWQRLLALLLSQPST